ncbi:hypothetical protein B0H12DRAFT_1093707 [Mycena haematopus]|nr:hypothetical protein B0H12DRAFT_1093707 [Mycena haematopus]
MVHCLSSELGLVSVHFLSCQLSLAPSSLCGFFGGTARSKFKKPVHLKARNLHYTIFGPWALVSLRRWDSQERFGGPTATSCTGKQYVFVALIDYTTEPFLGPYTGVVNPRAPETAQNASYDDQLPMYQPTFPRRCVRCAGSAWGGAGVRMPRVRGHFGLAHLGSPASQFS